MDAALARFEKALRQLEQSIASVHEREAQSKSLNGELQALRDDRSQLASELDDVRAKAKELSDLNRQAARRVDAAMERLKAVIGE